MEPQLRFKGLQREAYGEDPPRLCSTEAEEELVAKRDARLCAGLPPS